MNDPEQTTFLPDRQANMQALVAPATRFLFPSWPTPAGRVFFRHARRKGQA